MNQHEMNPVEIALAAIEVFAVQHPRPSQLTQVQAAEMLSISGPTLRKLIRAGGIRLNECGMIPTSEVDRVLAVRKT